MADDEPKDLAPEESSTDTLEAPPAPPLDADDYDDYPEPPRTRWPKVIGIISLIYAICGMLCQTTFALWLLFLMPMIMGMMQADEVTVPLVLKLIGIPQALLLLVLGIVLLLGSVKLLRRNRSGVGMLKQWAMWRVVLLVIGAGASIATLPAQIDMQTQMLEAQKEAAEDAGRPFPAAIPDYDTAWRRGVIGLGVFSGILAAYPVFLSFYLSRSKISDEVEQWI